MIIRPSDERGKNNFGWLDAKHSFSFGQYYNPKWTNFHNLLVINQDRIAPSMGFGTHPHRDMEIITYVIQGEIRHQDSMGNVGHIKPGEIQVMSAGTGVAHSEYNNKTDETTELLQIWIEPSEENLKPRYAEKVVYSKDENHFLKQIAGQTDSPHSIKLNAFGNIWLGKFNKAETINFIPEQFSHLWIQLIKGQLEVSHLDNSKNLMAGDGLGIEETKGSAILLKASAEAEFLMFEVN